ncbi:MAG: TetR/AcrR family transcriptional regulator C-terminal ligand-binding domain-containing protein [Acidimicrobiales bacterium]
MTVPTSTARPSIAAAAAAHARIDPRVARSRQAVLSAAAALLAELGWGRVTIEAVATRSGVARTTIYRHWPDLHHLLAEALGAVMDPCADPDTGSLRGDLTVVLNGLARTLTTSAAAGVLTSMIDAAERDPEIAERQRAFTQERRAASRRAIERAVARGEIPADVDVKVEASLIAGPLFYRRMVSREPLSEAFVDQIVAATCIRLGAP